MTTEGGVLIGPPEERADYSPLLRLVLVNAIAITGLTVLWWMGLLDLVLTTDHTRVSLIIFAILVGTTLHCFYQTIVAAKSTRACCSDCLRIASATAKSSACSFRKRCCAWPFWVQPSASS